MYLDHKVVVTIPAGRKPYLELLLPYLRRDRGLVDEVRLWHNSVNTDDTIYLRSLDDDFIHFIPHPQNQPTGNGFGIHPFYKDCQDENAVYIRIDDDVVWLQEGGLERLVKFRLAHPEYWLVSANLINNAVCSHIHQRLGMIPTDKGIYGYACMDSHGWRDPNAAEYVHRQFLDHLSKNELSGYEFPQWILWEYHRFSINMISWLGKDMKALNGVVDVDEEHDMAVHKSETQKRACAIYGGCIASHFSFHTQRAYLDSTDLLSKYKALSDAL